MFFKEKIIYTDVLDEWRKIKVGDFNLFDKVLIQDSEEIYVIIGTSTDHIYKTTYVSWSGKLLKSWNPSNLKWWVLEYKWESYEKISYDTYLIIDSKWKKMNSYEVKKYYWEFQKEFESLEKSIKYKEQLNEKIEELKTLEKSMNENYEISRVIQWKNYKDLWIL